jgi:hypothetical protein
MHFPPAEVRVSAAVSTAEAVSMVAEEDIGEHEATATGNSTEGEGNDACDEE